MALLANVLLVGLSLVLGARLVRQYRVRSRPHTLWYAVGLILVAAAAFPEVYRELTGTLPTALWWLYWSTGSSAVAYLGVGSAYLISPRVGQVSLVGFTVASIAAVVATVLTAGSGPAVFTADMLAKSPTVAIKVPFLINSIGGSLIIFGCAVWSYIKTRAMFAVWIALGTLVFAAGGTSSGLLMYSQVFYFTQTVGILLLYLGVASSLNFRQARQPVADM